MIDDLVLETARRLTQVWNKDPDGPSLRFPHYADKTPGAPAPRGLPPRVRVSEQEARVIMCQVLERLGILYSVECPTQQTYRFAGANDISARTDLAFHGTDGVQLAVEFKAGQPRQEDVDKDFEKLVGEGVPGLWFHTLAAANDATVPALVSKLRTGLRNGRERWSDNSDRKALAVAEHDHQLTFAVVVRSGSKAGLYSFCTTAGAGVDATFGPWLHQQT